MKNNRRQQILDLLKEEGAISVEKLSKLFNVTETSIRIDLRYLQSQGLIQRYHGGAKLQRTPGRNNLLLSERQNNLSEKRKIGKLASSKIDNGDIIILDSGSTTSFIADNIKNYKKLSVITSGVNIAVALGENPDINILLVGGYFKMPTLSTYGEKTAEFFKNIIVNKLFLATAAISSEHGLSYPSEIDIKLKLAMIQSAKEVFVVADSTKIDKVSMFILPCDWSKINYLITDNGITKEQIDSFSKLGIKVICPPA